MQRQSAPFCPDYDPPMARHGDARVHTYHPLALGPDPVRCQAAISLQLLGQREERAGLLGGRHRVPALRPAGRDDQCEAHGVGVIAAREMRPTRSPGSRLRSPRGALREER